MLSLTRKRRLVLSGTRRLRSPSPVSSTISTHPSGDGGGVPGHDDDDAADESELAERRLKRAGRRRSETAEGAANWGPAVSFVTRLVEPCVQGDARGN